MKFRALIAVAALAVSGLATAPAAQAASSLTVTVTTPSGTTVAGTSVTVSNADGSAYYWGYESTNSAGKAVFTGLAQGDTYTVSTTPYSVGYYEAVTTNVTISSSTATAALKIPGNEISGVVTANGKPLSNVSINIGGETSTDGWAQTDSAGRYIVLGLDAGVYTARVSDYSAPGILTTYAGNTVREPDARRIVVTTTSVTNDVNIAAVADARVKGVVVDKKGQPVAGVYVYGSNLDRFGYSGATTTATGAFSLSGLASGKVEIRASKGTKERTVKVKLTTGTTANAGSITLKKGKATGSVKGVVKNKAGKKADISVVVRKGTAATYYGSGATPNKKGKYTIKGLTPGTYRVVLSGTNISRTVKVKAKKTTKVKKFVRAKGTAIKGVIKTSKGKKLKKASVSVYDGYGSYLGRAQTNKKGKYTVKGAISGKYTVSVDGKGSDVSTSRTTTVRKGKTAKVSIRMNSGSKVKVTVRHGKKAVQGASVSTLDVYGKTTNAQGVAVVKPVRKGTQFVSISDQYTGGYLNASVKTSKKKVSVAVKTRP